VNEIRSWLYVGKYIDALNGTILEHNGIGAVLELHEPVTHDHIPTLFIPFQDGEPLHVPSLERAIAFVREQAALERRVLVACSAGISRSPLIAIAVLKIVEERTLLDALHEVRAKNPRTMPDHIIWEGLCAYFGEDIPFWDIWRETHEP
jgi:protein-tyrosine phosphatase